jgi:transposase-like protein
MRRRPDVDREVVRLYRRGRTVREIARELGCAAGTVWNRLVKAGVPRRAAGKPAADLEGLVRRYRAGDPLAEIARDAGITDVGLQLRLRRHGIPARSGEAARRREAAAEAIRLIDAGRPDAARAALEAALAGPRRPPARRPSGPTLRELIRS